MQLRLSGIYFQKLNVYQLSIFQNVDLYCSKNQTFFFSAGLGISPLFLTAEQSVFGNSETLLGGMGLLKFDFIFPFKNQYEWDLTLKSGWGNVGGHKIFISNIGLGINFE